MSARRLVLLAALSCAGVLAVAGPAFAHAAYEDSDPANGASVSSPPSRVITDFTEPLVDGSTLVVYDPCGRQVDNGDSLVAGDRITVTMSGEYEGVYTVGFEVVSGVDGHPTNGTFTFSSGGQPCPGEEPAAEEPQQPSGGGGSSDGGGASEYDSASSAQSSAGGSSATRPSSQGSAAGQSRSRDRAREGDAATGKRPGQGRSGQGELSAVVPNLNPASAAGQREQAATSVWDGIPLGPLLAGLALATLIGAAGGKVYAGIMGWTGSN